MRSQGDKQCVKCGAMYWRKAEWQHKCLVANVSPLDEVVANVVVTKVANKSKHGQYKDKEARLA